MSENPQSSEVAAHPTSTTTSDICFEVSFRFEVRRRTPRITPQPHITNIHIISYIVSSALVALLASSARARVLMRLRFIDEMWTFLKSDGRHGDRNPNNAPIQSLVLLDVTQKGEHCQKNQSIYKFVRCLCVLLL